MSQSVLAEVIRHDFVLATVTCKLAQDVLGKGEIVAVLRELEDQSGTIFCECECSSPDGGDTPGEIVLIERTGLRYWREVIAVDFTVAGKKTVTLPDGTVETIP